MQQIVDLQADTQFQALDVALISIATDSTETLGNARNEWQITTPMLSDGDKRVSNAYDVLQWAAATGEPGHTFILVDTNGIVRWIKDYGAPQNGGVMYVPVAELTQAIRSRLLES